MIIEVLHDSASFQTPRPAQENVLGAFRNVDGLHGATVSIFHDRMPC